MKFLKKIVVLFLAVNLAFGYSFSINAAGDPLLNYRKDFNWGVCMHTNYWGEAYKDFNMEDQIHLAAELGCKLIRTDGRASEQYLDKFMKLCHGYGIKVMLIGYFPGGETHTQDFDAEEIRKTFYELASRYDGKHGCGKADYIQIDNELDHSLMVASHPDGNYKNGKEISHYNKEYMDNYLAQVNAAIKGVRDSGTSAEIVINFVNDRYGLMDYFYQQNVDWDVTGMDWYSKIFPHGDTPFWLGDDIHKKYGKPIIICETNIHGKSEYFDEKDVTNFDVMVEAFEDFYSRDYVKGCCIYELSDELIFNEDGSYNQEGHFGLLFTNQNGTIKEPKPHYYRYKKIFGGKNLEKIDWQRFQVAFDNGIEYVVKEREEDSSWNSTYPDVSSPESTASSSVSNSSTAVNGGADGSDVSTEKKVTIFEEASKKIGSAKIPVVILAVAIALTVLFLIAGGIAVVLVVKLKKRKGAKVESDIAKESEEHSESLESPEQS